MSYIAQVESLLAQRLGTYMLDLPSCKTLVLKDYYYIPKVIRNIISISLLLKQSYEIRLMGNDSYIDNNLLILILNEINFMNALFSFLINFMTVVILTIIF